MDNNRNRPEWMKDDLVKNIDPKKLDFLEKMFAEGNGKSQKEMMTLLMPLMKKAKQEGLTFSPQEITASINAIKKHSSEEELKKIDEILKKTNNKNN